MSWFSRITDTLVESQFRKDPSGRLVFVPISRKGKCYFVDSKADEEKIRAFVRMYRIPSTFLSLLLTPFVLVPLFTLEHVGLAPRAHSLTIIVGLCGFLWLSSLAFSVLLWIVYKTSVPGFSASLTEVGPDIKAQLDATSPQQQPRRQRMVLVCLFAGLVLVGLALVLFTGYRQ